MDEKADVTPPEDEIPPTAAATDAVSAVTDAGNTNDDVLTTETDSLISVAAEIAASTETDTSTQTLATESTTSTATIESSTSEGSITNTSAPTDNLISSDALSVQDALTSVDDLRSAEELTSENVKASANSVMNAVSPVDTVSPSPVVCQLEEELKRLHEGDPTEDTQSTDREAKTVKMPVSQSTTKPLVELTKVEVNPEEMLAAENVSKDPILIKRAQDDFKNFDVLVCGKCHEVFHFVEDFQRHKSNARCKEKSHLVATCDGESKPQVWGFTLWKHRQHKLLEEGETVPSSWAVYQKWCKLPQADKDAWITAGQTIQFCTKIGTAKVTEMKLKTVSSKQMERDPLALDGFAESNKENSVLGNVDSKPSDVIKKTIIKPVRLNNDVTILPSSKSGDPNSNKALRTVRSTEKREYVVERIVAKRFNPKRKMWEYQIKWENFPSDQNTWEPLANLNHCKQMVEEFEEQLKKLKAEKVKQQAAGMVPKGRGRPMKHSPTVSTPSSSFSGDSTPGRPTRTSKQKALNQVKAWCGNISDTDEGGVKRSFEDDDSDDSFEKKMKYEDYSDDSDVDVKPRLPTFKKIAPKPTQPSQHAVHIIKNGLGGMNPLPQNVLIPDANGVVRINQKQLPSLSTGVYIMSKTAGIIKLDSTTSKVATSGGQTIVKVAPKIGQTQIKIVKKDGQTTTTKQIIQMASNRPAAPRTFKPVITKVRKAVEVPPKPAAVVASPAPTKIVVKPKEQPPPPTLSKEEESDDGLEELPFPEEIKLPEPESPPPPEFDLDPVTGKIAGREYPDPPPQPEPEAEQGDEEKMEVEDTSLENIVKLAAADITEDDLKNETEETRMEIDEQEREEVRKKPEQRALAPAKTPIKVMMTPTLVKSTPSILNKALSSSNILRKSLLTSPPPPQPKIQQRILNPSIGPRGLMTRPSPRSASLIRTRPTAPKPKFNIAASSGVIRSQHEFSPRNVYSKTTTVGGVTRKIGNTTIRSATGGYGQRPVARIIQTTTGVHRASPRKEPVMIRQVVERSPVAARPKTVISMPSLIADDESMPSPPQAPEAAKPPTPPTPSLPIATPAPVVESPPPLTPAPLVEPPVETPVEPVTEASTSAGATTDISSFTLTDNENPIFITGDDGTVYQVAGQNEHGQTILLTQGSDGQQQCLLVTNEVAETPETTEEPQPEVVAPPEVPTAVTEPLSVKTDEDVSDQVVAQVVRAEPPSPGGTHKVVVMLPDGNLMVTQVSPEEYASLELE